MPFMVGLGPGSTKSWGGVGASGGPNAGRIISGMAAYAGSYVSQTPSNYTGGMFTWSDTQTFTNNKTNSASTDAIRGGSTNDSTFTAGSNVESFGTNTTTVLAWQNTRSTTPPNDQKINGTTATVVRSDYYQASSISNNDKIYYSSYNLFTANVELTSSTYASVDFRNGGGVQQANDKGGFCFLPGSWKFASEGTAMSGSGNVTIPPKQIVLLIANESSDDFVNIFNFSDNPNVEWIMNLCTRWYDNVNVAIIGNPTGSPQDVPYSFGVAAINATIPVYFKL